MNPTKYRITPSKYHCTLVLPTPEYWSSQNQYAAYLAGTLSVQPLTYHFETKVIVSCQLMLLLIDYSFLLN
jgi:hypothetical protein